MLTNLLKKNLQFILFGGKGGVGKTTMAAASAIQFAKHFPKKKILVFTTDPAPSLADSFAQNLANEPVKIEGFQNLWAMEINAQKELEKFKKRYGEDILDILQQGTYLSNEETEEIFSLDIPGLDEVMGLKKITDFMEAAESGARKNADNDAEKHGNKSQMSDVNGQMFDMYILDTAPTGHTLRLLMLPELLDDWIKFLANLRWKYHYMVDRLSRGKAKKTEKADEFLLDMKKTVKKVQNFLRNPEKTNFVVVTIPEAMGVEETKDLIQDLKKSKTPVQHIIINNIVPAFAPSSAKAMAGKKASAGKPEDELSFLQKRRTIQDRYIKETKSLFPDFTITEIYLEPDEIRGKDKLTSLGEKLFKV